MKNLKHNIEKAADLIVNSISEIEKIENNIYNEYKHNEFVLNEKLELTQKIKRKLDNTCQELINIMYLLL